MTVSARAAGRMLRRHATPANAAILQRFFKTGPGEYGEGDVFVGVKVPATRRVCRECRGMAMPEIERLLTSKVHEERLLALLLLVDAFKAAADAGRRRIYDFYLDHTAYINNWDLVDASAPQIVGAYLRDRGKAPLTRLARSRSLWERRIAMIATFDFIRRGDLAETFRIADLLLDDEHDLIHKAVGWMLREAGKRDGAALRQFLASRCRRMPRTALRYAIERLPEAERRRFLAQPARSASRSRGSSTKSSRPSKAPSSKR
jgi:3-methyladenine DNA glycosylase AlkD